MFKGSPESESIWGYTNIDISLTCNILLCSYFKFANDTVFWDHPQETDYDVDKMISRYGMLCFIIIKKIQNKIKSKPKRVVYETTTKLKVSTCIFWNCKYKDSSSTDVALISNYRWSDFEFKTLIMLIMNEPIDISCFSSNLC